MQHPDIVFTHPDLDNDTVQADLRHDNPDEHCNVCDETLQGIHIVLKPRRGHEEAWCLSCFATIAPACRPRGSFLRDFPETG